jgi:sulfatase modifying factor 1
MGDGKWAQSDLAGNAWEWNLDWLANYATPCTDCADLTPASERVTRSGGFYGDGSSVLASLRSSGPPQDDYDVIGLRCARAP